MRAEAIDKCCICGKRFDDAHPWFSRLRLAIDPGSSEVTTFTCCSQGCMFANLHRLRKAGVDIYANTGEAA